MRATQQHAAVREIDEKRKSSLTEADDCDLIAKAATDFKRRRLFGQVAERFRWLAERIGQPDDEEDASKKPESRGRS
jgi:hypothetical protein